MPYTNLLRNSRIIMKRELAGYFGSPVAYVFIVIFSAVDRLFYILHQQLF